MSSRTRGAGAADASLCWEGAAHGGRWHQNPLFLAVLGAGGSVPEPLKPPGSCPVMCVGIAPQRFGPRAAGTALPFWSTNRETAKCLQKGPVRDARSQRGPIQEDKHRAVGRFCWPGLAVSPFSCGSAYLLLAGSLLFPPAPRQHFGDPGPVSRLMPTRCQQSRMRHFGTHGPLTPSSCSWELGFLSATSSLRLWQLEAARAPSPCLIR